MIKFIFLFLFQFLCPGFILAQNSDISYKLVDSSHKKIIRAKNDSLDKTVSRLFTDSITRSDSSETDSVLKQLFNDAIWTKVAAKFSGNNFIRLGFTQNKFFGFSSLAIAITSNKKEFKGKELLFYTLIALLLFFAFIKFSFPKYFIELFRVVFRTTLKQRQIGEQLIQAPIPSLLLNFFFLISTGLYIDFLLQHFYMTNGYNFWLLYFYCCIALSVIYIMKFLSLKFSGWLFNISPATDGYISIVFMINKIIGIYLLPFLVLLAFSENDIYQIVFPLSYIGIFGLLAYRFILSYGLIYNQISLNPFHFLLYLCAFEIVPLLVIYKALLIWFVK